MIEEVACSELDNIVDSCVSRIEAGQATVQGCLLAYPHLAEELEPILYAAQSLFATHLPPMDPLGSQIVRTRVLFHAAKLEREKRKPESRGFPKMILRFALAVVIVVLTMGAGGRVWVASADSLPGEPLYLVKRVTETMQMALTQDPARRADLHLFFTQRRLDEAIQQYQRMGTWNEDTLNELNVELQAAVSELERSERAAAENGWNHIVQIGQAIEQRLSGMEETTSSKSQMLRDLPLVRDKALKATGKYVEATPRPTSQPTASAATAEPTPKKTEVAPKPTPKKTEVAPKPTQQEKGKPEATEQVKEKVTGKEKSTENIEDLPPGQVKEKDKTEKEKDKTEKETEEEEAVEENTENLPPGQTKEKDKTEKEKDKTEDETQNQGEEQQSGGESNQGSSGGSNSDNSSNSSGGNSGGGDKGGGKNKNK